VNIQWANFPLVVGATLFAAAFVVTTFSLALRFGDGTARWRRPVSVVLYVACGACVLFGLYLIIPYFHR
jgi:hypothetical protein